MENLQSHGVVFPAISSLSSSTQYCTVEFSSVDANLQDAVEALAMVWIITIVVVVVVTCLCVAGCVFIAYKASASQRVVVQPAVYGGQPGTYGAQPPVYGKAPDPYGQ